MTGAQSSAPRQADERPRRDPQDCATREPNPPSAAPLPGVMDFIGAHVGDELAEERWR